MKILYNLILIVAVFFMLRCTDTGTTPEEKFGKCIVLFEGMKALANAISGFADSIVPPQTPSEQQLIDDRRKQLEGGNGVELCTILYLLDSANEVSKK